MASREPHPKRPQRVDHTVSDQFDAFLMKAWKIDRLESHRNPLAEWNELVKAILKDLPGTQPEGRDGVEVFILPLVVRFLEEFGENGMAGVANVVPKDSLALASVKKLLRLWARNTATDKGILAGAADQIVSWAREIRTSQPRESDDDPVHDTLPSANVPWAVTPLEQQMAALAYGDHDVDGDSADGDAPSGGSKVAIGKKQLPKTPFFGSGQAPSVAQALHQGNTYVNPAFLQQANQVSAMHPGSMHPEMMQYSFTSPQYHENIRQKYYPPLSVVQQRRQTSGQQAVEVNNLGQRIVPRIFADLPTDETVMPYNETVLLFVEQWPNRDPRLLVEGLRAYFTKIPSYKNHGKGPRDRGRGRGGARGGAQANEGDKEGAKDGSARDEEAAKQFRLRLELADFVRVRLCLAVSRIHRTYLTCRDTEFPYACRDVDTELRDLDHKRNIVMVGQKEADDIQFKIANFAMQLPNWVKARNAVMSSRSQGFRAGVHQDTGAPHALSVDPLSQY